MTESNNELMSKSKFSLELFTVVYIRDVFGPGPAQSKLARAYISDGSGLPEPENPTRTRGILPNKESHYNNNKPDPKSHAMLKYPKNFEPDPSLAYIPTWPKVDPGSKVAYRKLPKSALVRIYLAKAQPKKMLGLTSGPKWPKSGPR